MRFKTTACLFNVLQLVRTIPAFSNRIPTTGLYVQSLQLRMLPPL